MERCCIPLTATLAALHADSGLEGERAKVPKQRCLATIVDLGLDGGDVALLLAPLAEDGPERVGDELPFDAAVVRARAAGPAGRTHPAGRALLAGHGPGAAARRLVQRPLTGRLRVATGRGSGTPESGQAVIRSPARWSRRGRGWRVPAPLQCWRHPSLLAHEQGGAGPASARPRGSAPVHPYAHPARDGARRAVAVTARHARWPHRSATHRSDGIGSGSRGVAGSRSAPAAWRLFSISPIMIVAGRRAAGPLGLRTVAARSAAAKALIRRRDKVTGPTGPRHGQRAGRRVSSSGLI
jgi:hypothetical protein